MFSWRENSPKSSMLREQANTPRQAKKSTLSTEALLRMDKNLTPIRIETVLSPSPWGRGRLLKVGMRVLLA